MEINLIALAIPIFLIAIAIEYWVSIRSNQTLYYLNDFANNLSCGILEQVSMLPLQGLLIFSYDYLYHHHAFFAINPKVFYSWVLLWLGVDFLYYWFHRASHRNTFLWAGHSVHHQSEQYNFSVALRQGIIQTLFGWVIYLPLALLGFPTWMFLIVASLNTLYQFWIHTKLIHNMGWFEIFFNTPSHHRVHHGKNKQYLDKNYGGSLIIWDKLFDTFERETVPVEYGTTAPLNSWNPFYANIKVIYDTFYYGKHLSSWKERVQAFFRPPEWIVNRLHEPFHSCHIERDKDHLQYPTVYILLNVLISILGYSYYLIIFNPNTPLSWVLGLFVLITLYLIGFILNRGVIINIKYTELFRSVLVLIIVHLLFMNYWLDFTSMFLFFVVNIFLYKKRGNNQGSLNHLQFL
ncbi:sterol desaturase family protein [Legionella lansingensis]